MPRLRPLAAALPAGAASARSSTEIAGPAGGGGAPPAVRMAFGGVVRIAGIMLTDPSGAARPLGRTARMAPVGALVATPETPSPGACTVAWPGVSTDGHAMDGGRSRTVE